MIKNYLKSVYNKFINSKVVTKVIIISICLILVFMTVISFWKVDYIITTPGYLGNSAGTVTIKEASSNTNVRFVTVITYDNPSLIQYWAAKLDKRLNVEKVEPDYDYDAEKPISITSKWISINKAIMFAYEKASEVNPNVNLVKTFMGVIVYYATSEAETNLESGDIITEVEGVSIESYEHLRSVYEEIITSNSKKAGDYINFKVRTVKNDTLVERSAKLYEDDGTLTTGLYLEEYYNLDAKNSTPEFTINYNEDVDSSGNSGGAMLALSIYSRLIEEDIIGNLYICGTGTISLDGTIGRIGSVEQKVVKAYQNNVDVFFVDDTVYVDSEGNKIKTDYELCIEAATEYGYDTSFIKPVKTFDDILKILKEMKGEENAK